MSHYMVSDSYCEIDSVLYSAVHGAIRWYDTEGRKWREVMGLVGLPKLPDGERIQRDVRLADYGGKMAVLWERSLVMTTRMLRLFGVRRLRLKDFWWDSWTTLGPLIDFIGPTGPRMLRLPLDARVCDAIRGTDWNLPNARSDSVQTLQILLTTMPLPSQEAGQDVFMWRKPSGRLLKNLVLKRDLGPAACNFTPSLLVQAGNTESLIHSLAGESQAAAYKGPSSKLGNYSPT
ncbi:unnamed protein product [Microthlaspi erraticum]|uniref:Uncharacterized protein n=1 Tax=Microthlaspi erraticum TaxID=1685480 RepID=A0A6D2J980_9BRAS|nr:unnamed protein product [Microthlaspi erraticum]